MPKSMQEKRLHQKAKKFKALFKIQGLAETSFISTARLEGYSSETIYKVAAKNWPNGYSAERLQGKWCFQS